MKTFLRILGLVAGIFIAGTLVQAAPPTTSNVNKDTAPYVSKYGSNMRNNSIVTYGGPEDSVSCTGFTGIALVTITAGDTLIGVSSTPYARGVSKSASDAPATTIGIAKTSATYGNEVEVCQSGYAKALIDPGLVITYGMFLVNSATGTGLCGVSQSASLFERAVSKTAVVARSMAVKTTSATDKYITVQVINQ